MFKNFVRGKIEKYVQRYFAKHPEVQLVVVAGSVGKTSTKRAVATLLSRRYRVRMNNGNHNTEFSVPLALLGITYPAKVHSMWSWLAVFRAARARIRQPSDVDIVVQELGTDAPGDIAHFGSYLRPNLALVTAVTPEHMEFFGTIDAVAAEELSVAKFSTSVLVNRDDIDARFAEYLTNVNFTTYGTSGSAEYHMEPTDFSIDSGYKGLVYAPNLAEPIEAAVRLYGEHSLRPVMGAVAAALQFGLTPDEIRQGLAEINPVPGRMNVLKGIDDTTIIDDTYNSSPAAAAAALQTLYSIDSDDVPQRIAVLGDMRELGSSSADEHRKIGELCDPNLLAWVVLVGPESEQYLAPAARARGCQVHVAKNAIEAGKFVRSVTEHGALILVKGSQNTIYMEECVKILCNMTEDVELVRQSADWIKIKDDFFSRY